MVEEEERVATLATSLGVCVEALPTEAQTSVPTGSVGVRSREGALVLWSHEAAQRSGTLLDWLEMRDETDGVFPAPMIGTTPLRLLAGPAVERRWSWPTLMA